MPNTETMQATGAIIANDGDTRVEIIIKCFNDGGLTEDELLKLARSVTRSCADSLKFAPYSDFGADNTTVELK